MRGLLISDFNVQTLAGYLTNEKREPSMKVEVGPFGQVIPTLLDKSLECWHAKPDFCVVWTRPDGVLSSFASILNGSGCDWNELDAEVDTFAAALAAASSDVKVILLPLWTLSSRHQGSGIGDLRKPSGVTRSLLRANSRLLESIEQTPAIIPLSAGEWFQTIGEKSYNSRLWYLSKTPFGNELLKEAANAIRAALNAAEGKSRKLVVLDLDDTLWGGIVGDVGQEGIVLGGHDPTGEALVEFQRQLLAFKKRGIVLGIVSKNEESVALSAINNHPEMVLRQTDFGGWRINWGDKAENIMLLLQELNLPPDAAVFIDDNPAERDRIRSSIPGLLVPDWPEDKRLYADALLRFDCFQQGTISEEDLVRTRMYEGERVRKESRKLAQSFDEWLMELQITVEVQPLERNNLARITQLLNKTNQMNLATRRLSEMEVKEWASRPHRVIWGVRVRDKFGDSGLCGILSLESHLGNVELVDFVLSCRVLGRQIEETMIALAVEWAQDESGREVRANYLPTTKNKPCLDFFKRSGLKEIQPGCFVWPLGRPYPRSSYIKIEQVATADCQLA